MRELIDLLEARDKLLNEHPYAAVSMISVMNSKIFDIANQVREDVMDFALKTMIGEKS